MPHPSLCFDDQTVLAVKNEFQTIPIRADSASKPRSKWDDDQELALAKVRSLEEEFKGDYDETRQLSHMTFAQKGSVCYEGVVYVKGREATKEIVRVTHEGWKVDTCTLNKAIRREQSKPRGRRDERSLLYFPKLTSVDVERPVLVTVEERIVGRELLDVIETCRLPFGPQRLGYMTNLFMQMCHGIAFLHENGYTHNDLAPDNILVEDGFVRIKIIDFDSAVNLNNPAHPSIVDRDGTMLHDWFSMKLYHKEAYRAVECWKAYELVCTNQQRQIFLDLKAADTFALLMVFWQMLMGQTPPVHQLTGARDLAKEMAEFGDMPGGGQAELNMEFEQGFDLYFSDVLDGLDNYPKNIRDDLESLFESLADIECKNLDDVGKLFQVKVKRDSVEDILRMEFLSRVRTI